MSERASCERLGGWGEGGTPRAALAVTAGRHLAAAHCSCLPAPAPPPRCRHYTHTLEGSQINSVQQARGTGTAAVSATFREAVEAHRGAGEPVQSFRWELGACVRVLRRR